MPRRPPTVRRLATASRWPVGVVLTAWRYLWRTTPMRRVELAGSLRHDMPPALPAAANMDEMQLPEDGYGPLMHRRYRVRVAGRGGGISWRREPASSTRRIGVVRQR